MSHSRPLVRAYVDETGDRGTSATSSQYFAMAGVVVADEDEHLLRQAIADLRNDMCVPSGKPLHWQEHVKVYPRRQRVASRLAGLPLLINYVIFEKTAIPAASGLAADQVIFYNYAAGLMLERLVLTAQDWPGGSRSLVARFGHVRGVDHTTTSAYFKRKPSQHAWMPWHLLSSPPQFTDAGAYDGLQAADQYAGMLNAALRPDRYGGFEPPHLLAVRHQIRRLHGRSWGIGFKVLAQPGRMESYPWWPAEGL